MLLKEIYESATYVTDEEMTTTQVINAANAGIAEVNTKTGTNLPFIESINYQETAYSAITGSWLMRLLEPYLSYSIAANDSDINARDFHYNRFLAALSDFRSSGIADITKEIIDEDGNIIETGYEGKSKRVVPIDASARKNPFAGWWL